jgi:hypothetical protein
VPIRQPAGDGRGTVEPGTHGREMKECAWVQPERVAESEFLEWTAADHLRHTKFVHLENIRMAHPARQGESCSSMPNTNTTYRNNSAPESPPGHVLAIYAAWLFCFAHRALCASAIRLRPAADMVRFFTSVGFGLLLDPGGLPRLRGLSVPAKSARACCSRAISSSMLRSRSVTFDSYFICLQFTLLH